MKLVAGLILAWAATAHAETSLDENGPGDAPHPLRQLVSAGCEVDVELRGAVATVELREHLENPGPEALAAMYEPELPPGAVVVGAAIQRGRATAPAPGTHEHRDHRERAPAPRARRARRARRPAPPPRSATRIATAASWDADHRDRRPASPSPPRPSWDAGAERQVRDHRGLAGPPLNWTVIATTSLSAQ